MKFALELIKWYQAFGRDLPWRQTKNPYFIWISEIILQQTRVSFGLSYYWRLITQFPTVQSLAEATEDTVFKAWEGLGYYSRAKNLHKTAKIIAASEGQFPKTVEELESLPGVGPYTARAIAAFAFDQPVTALDGNLVRVLSRIWAEPALTNTAASRKQFQARADKLIDECSAATFNSAMMDLANLICLPKNPNCLLCPIQTACRAFQEKRVHEFPIKPPKKSRKQQQSDFLLLESPAGIRIRKRTEKGIWHGLWEIPNFPILPQAYQQAIPITNFIHVLTHLDWQIQAYYYWQETEQTELPGDWVPVEKINNLSFPKAILRIFYEWNQLKTQTLFDPFYEPPKY
ncbi:MAG: A/G-specific adenine glycosylase [Bacteroidia bacterium]|nr:A/G-specific adenine glycosylase [Bacteroidia bacterium]